MQTLHVDSIAGYFQNAHVARSGVEIEGLGVWLAYLRKRAKFSQKRAAKAAGLSLDSVRRVEQGYNVGVNVLLPFLAWLAKIKNETVQREIERDLMQRLVEAGDAISAASAPSTPERGSAQPRKTAAVG